MGTPEPSADKRERFRGGWEQATRTPTARWVIKVLVAVGQVAALVGVICRSCG